MKFISHRGNIFKKIIEKENSVDYVLESLNMGYDCEIDLWNVDSQFYLGHDFAQFPISYSFLEQNKNKLWVHCKNIEAVVALDSKKDINYFWHQEDKITLTSKNFIWAYPGNQPISNSIAVLPELFNEIKLEVCYGICSDNIEFYRKKYEKI